VPAVGCIKVARQAGCLAVRANVDVYWRTIDTVEARANNVLLTTTSNISISEKDIEIFKENYPLEASDVGVRKGCQKGHWALIGKKSRAATHIAHPHCHMFQRHLVRMGDCAFAERALPSVPGKGGSDGCCARRCTRHLSS